MTKIKETLKKAADDAVNKVFFDQKSRAGSSAANISSALKNKVAPSAVAAQVNENIKKNNPGMDANFTGKDMQIVANFYDANKSRPAFTKQQTKAMIKLVDEVGLSGAAPA